MATWREVVAVAAGDWHSAKPGKLLLGRLADPGLSDPTTLTVDDQRRMLVANRELDHAPGGPPHTVSALPRPR